VARVATRLTLVERGLDPKSLVVVEAGHRELRAEYEATLSAYADGNIAPGWFTAPRPSPKAPPRQPQSAKRSAGVRNGRRRRLRDAA